MPSQIYRRVRRERLVTYVMWLAMIGLLAWGVIEWVNYLSERAELAERRADHMADLLAESERTQDHLAKLVASLEEQEKRTRAQRQRFRQDVNAILERLGIEVREQAESSGGPPTGREQSSSVTLPGEDGRVRRSLRVPSSEPDLSPDPPRESATGGEAQPGQRDPPAPAPKPKPKTAVKPTQPSQARPNSRERPQQAAEHGPPDYAHAHGQDKPKARASKHDAPSHAQGGGKPPGKPPNSAPGRPDAKGPPSHAAAKGHSKKPSKRSKP